MSYSSEVLADSALAVWLLEETSGTAAADSSGNGRHLTINGTLTLGAPTVMPTGSGSVDFPGATSAHLRRASEAWSATSSFTVTAWVRADSLSSYRAIWSRDADSAFSRGPTLYLTSGKLNLFVNSDTLGATTLTTGTAYFVGVTYDAATTTVRFYVNGTLDQTVTKTISNTASVNDIVIGASRAGTSSLNFPWDGRIGPVAYFSTALSGARIAAHYAAGIGAAAPPISGTLAATLPGPLS